MASQRHDRSRPDGMRMLERPWVLVGPHLSPWSTADEVVAHSTSERYAECVGKPPKCVRRYSCVCPQHTEEVYIPEAGDLATWLWLCPPGSAFRSASWNPSFVAALSCPFDTRTRPAVIWTHWGACLSVGWRTFCWCTCSQKQPESTYTEPYNYVRTGSFK